MNAPSAAPAPAPAPLSAAAPETVVARAPRLERPPLRALPAALRVAWRRALRPDPPTRVAAARLPDGRPFEVEVHGGTDMYISRPILAGWGYEALETEVFAALLPRASRLLDVGANIGWYTVIAGLLRPGLPVAAFEPDPANAALLRRNVARHALGGATRVVEAALSDRDGAGSLSLSPDNMGDHRAAGGAGRPTLPILLRRLDTTGLRLDGATLLKLDTQGSEARILAGARGALRRGELPVALVEFWPHGLAAAGDDALALHDVLTGLGWSPHVLLSEERRLRPFARDEVVARLAGDLAPATEHYVDLLLVPEGRTLASLGLGAFAPS